MLFPLASFGVIENPLPPTIVVVAVVEAIAVVSFVAIDAESVELPSAPAGKLSSNPLPMFSSLTNPPLLGVSVEVLRSLIV